MCTSRSETAAESAAHYGARLAFHDYHAMLTHPDIDLVSVSVRVPLHHDEEVPQGPPFNVAQMYHRLSAAIRERREAHPNFDVAVKRHRLLDAIQRAADRGSRVAVA